jgi:2-polyprenyl-6-methoxyphenol hydroxylase-like FAD-dependent oxidoreductase
MRILISGAGIAGPTLAYWLAHYGFTPTIVERAARLRTGGYVIDFWGAGFDIADRMGLRTELTRKGYRVREVRVVDQRGRRVAGFPAEAFAQATDNGYVSLPRGELAASIFGRIDGRVETIWGNSVVTSSRTTNGYVSRSSEERHEISIWSWAPTVFIHRSATWCLAPNTALSGISDTSRRF